MSYRQRLAIFIGFYALASLSLSAETAQHSLDQFPLGAGLTCLQEKDNRESSNSFLVESDGQRVLIDGGWSNDSKVPVALSEALRSATKVATHFHYDHIRQWPTFDHILLSQSQARLCPSSTCQVSRWQSVNRVESFNHGGTYPDNIVLGGGLRTIPCGGHSSSDACFIHAASKTLFLGDIFYPGPIFAFLPGGSPGKIAETLKVLLARQDWDKLGLTHGACTTSRAAVATFLQALEGANAGRLRSKWDFSFWLPLKRYDMGGDALFVRPF